MHQHRQRPVSAPQTRGRTIRWATLYDPCVRLLTLGHAPQLRRRTLDLAGILPGESVLDVGCGTGDLLLAAQARHGSAVALHGIDAAPEMIAVAQRKAARAGAAVDFRVSVIEALPYADSSFDVVLSSLMMHHLPDDLKRVGLREIRRVLRPGGRLLIVDFERPRKRSGGALLTLLMHAPSRLGAQDLVALVTDAGFEAPSQGPAGFPTVGFVRARRV